MRTTLPRPLPLFEEQLIDPSVASTLTCPKYSSQPVAFCLLPHTTAWRKRDSPPPTALFLSVFFRKWAKNPSATWEFLCFSPQAAVAALSPSLDLPWSLPGEWSLLDSSPVHPVCRTGSEFQTLDLFPYSASLVMIYMVDQMDCFPVSCEKTLRTSFVFLPLEAHWFITENEFSGWHQPVHESGVPVGSPGRRDSSVPRPNISVSLSRSLLLTKPISP